MHKMFKAFLSVIEENQKQPKYSLIIGWLYCSIVIKWIGILYSIKNEWTTAKCNNMDESYKRNVEQKTLDAK